MIVREILELGGVKMAALNSMIETQLKENGRTQTWTINKMNEINPKLKMDRSKMSAIINDNRKMTAEELLAFCMALKISPDIFTVDELFKSD